MVAAGSVSVGRPGSAQITGRVSLLKKKLCDARRSAAIAGFGAFARIEALKIAQRAVREFEDATASCAAFICVGDAGPLSSRD
jgi:hypothetical protein